MNDLPTDSSGDRKPIPDPTTLTTEALHREADSIRREMQASMNLCELRVQTVERVLGLRLDHLEEKSGAFNRVAVRFPMVVGYIAALSFFAIVLFVVSLIR